MEQRHSQQSQNRIKMKDFDDRESYEKGFLIPSLFPLNNVGIVSAKDSILIDNNQNPLAN